VRMDPFLHTPAMHTGLDLVAQTGDPVRATADFLNSSKKAWNIKGAPPKVSTTGRVRRP